MISQHLGTGGIVFLFNIEPGRIYRRAVVLIKCTDQGVIVYVFVAKGLVNLWSGSLILLKFSEYRVCQAIILLLIIFLRLFIACQGIGQEESLLPFPIKT